ncbi:MAG: MBL fold metallo-hydrolase [Thiohalorhabdus sp.]|uniref:MBL fold metallo-hydrolase n=1 Tax=Thiohalorhabdus sp. TaxID=3094134 RepID=UPI0039817600
MIFRQLMDPGTGALSYLLGDPVAGEGVLVDPVYEQSREYLELLRYFGLRLRYLVETRLHDGRLSASPVLREESGARIAVHGAAGLGCADLRLHHGDLLHFGEETAEILHVSGISPCAVALHWRDRLFTGEALLAGRLGCPSQESGDPASLCAGIRERLFHLPGEILVFPGWAWDGRRVSTLAQEWDTNPDLLAKEACSEMIAARCREGRMTPADPELRVINQRCATRNLTP